MQTNCCARSAHDVESRQRRNFPETYSVNYFAIFIPTRSLTKWLDGTVSVSTAVCRATVDYGWTLRARVSVSEDWLKKKNRFCLLYVSKPNIGKVTKYCLYKSVECFWMSLWPSVAHNRGHLVMYKAVRRYIQFVCVWLHCRCGVFRFLLSNYFRSIIFENIICTPIGNTKWLKDQPVVWGRQDVRLKDCFHFIYRCFVAFLFHILLLSLALRLVISAPRWGLRRTWVDSVAEGVWWSDTSGFSNYQSIPRN